MLKRMILVVLSLLLLCSCQSKEPDVTENVMVVNPFTTHETLTEAEKAANITLTLPEDLTSHEEIIYRAANSTALNLIEVIYTDESGEVRIRKGIGKEDISGVYTEYALETEYCGDDLSFTLKGDGKKDYLAIWADDHFCYSIYAEQGMDSAALQDLVYAIK